MIRRATARLGYVIRRPSVLLALHDVVNEGQLSRRDRADLQDLRLRRLIAHSVRNVPYYSNLFAKNRLSIDDIRRKSDLVKLPILTKAEIRADPDAFRSVKRGKVVAGATGGSTGTPLRYVMTDSCYCRGVALLYRGLGRAGYRLGDSMLVIGGGSLTSRDQSLKSRLQDLTLNVKHVSSYGLDSARLLEAYRLIVSWKPRFIRGYATSLFIIAKYIEDAGLTVSASPQALFSTSEVMLASQRLVIERVFKAPVFDNYGLNDGGISAFECHHHFGMHVDQERGILEVTDDEGTPIVGSTGRILATSLYNFAMPFIRYDTGDLATLVTERCRCGSDTERLLGVQGRVTDYLKLNDVIIGSPQLTVVMGKIDVEYYQITQLSSNALQISIVPGPTFTSEDERWIANSIAAHVGSVSVSFVRMTAPPPPSDRKHKFIINDVCR